MLILTHLFKSIITIVIASKLFIVVDVVENAHMNVIVVIACC